MDKNTLCSMFPELAFAKEADAFLSACPDMAVPEQLRARKINRIELKSLLSSGGLRINPGKDSFSVQLNDLGKTNEWAETLGHEIGHTFHFDISVRPLLDLCAGCRKDKDKIGKFEMIENFCNEFSRRWSEINVKEKVAERIKNTLSLVFQTWSATTS